MQISSAEVKELPKGFTPTGEGPNRAASRRGLGRNVNCRKQKQKRTGKIGRVLVTKGLGGTEHKVTRCLQFIKRKLIVHYN